MNFVEVSLTEDTVNKFQEDEIISLNLENLGDKSLEAGTVLMDIRSKDELLEPSEISYLDDGMETPLDHSDDLKIAHVYILIKSVGGGILSSEENRIMAELPMVTDSE